MGALNESKFRTFCRPGQSKGGVGEGFSRPKLSAVDGVKLSLTCSLMTRTSDDEIGKGFFAFKMQDRVSVLF